MRARVKGAKVRNEKINSVWYLVSVIQVFTKAMKSMGDLSAKTRLNLSLSLETS